MLRPHLTGILLLAPFLLLRFGLLARLGKEAVARAARFAPLEKKELPAYWVYQLSTAGLILLLPFSRVHTAPLSLLVLGGLLYGAGLALLTASLLAFAAPSEEGFCQSGAYRFSRNPMYVAYFLYFLGCALLAQSLPLLALLLPFQLSAHWIVRSEERWCVQAFGAPYLRYMEKVRRYL